MVSIKLILKYYGVYEWLVVRLSAISITLYVIYLFVFLLYSHDLSYIDWYNFFYNKSNKIFNFILLLFGLVHTWIGMRHILEDYIKSSILRRIGIGIICTVLYIYLLLGIIVIWGL